MKKIMILFVLLIVTGCTRYIAVPGNNTHTESSHYYYNTTTEYVNVTQDCVQVCNVTEADPKYVLGLIQQIKRCENNLVTNINLTECTWELEKINRSLGNCTESLEDIKDLID